jgi:hypothetical protein
VSDETIDDAYAAFILYCNPNFPASTDTNELVKLFRTPPRSDGNAFSTWTLFELIRKFDSKEIKTWTQLALDLGVKPPNTDEGQSTQKVQQYSVRLKVRALQFTHSTRFSCLASAASTFFSIYCYATFRLQEPWVPTSAHARHAGCAAQSMPASNTLL